MVGVRYNRIHSTSHNGTANSTANSLQPPHAPVSAPHCLLLCEIRGVRVEGCAYVVLPTHHNLLSSAEWRMQGQLRPPQLWAPVLLRMLQALLGCGSGWRTSHGCSAQTPRYVWA